MLGKVASGSSNLITRHTEWNYGDMVATRDTEYGCGIEVSLLNASNRLDLAVSSSAKSEDIKNISYLMDEYGIDAAPLQHHGKIL